MDFWNYEWLGILALFGILIAFLPNLRTISTRQTARTLPRSRLVTFIVSSFLWIIYGIRDSSVAIVLAAIVAFIWGIFLLIYQLQAREK